MCRIRSFTGCCTGETRCTRLKNLLYPTVYRCPRGKAWRKINGRTLVEHLWNPSSVGESISTPDSVHAAKRYRKNVLQQTARNTRGQTPAINLQQTMDCPLTIHAPQARPRTHLHCVDWALEPQERGDCYDRQRRNSRRQLEGQEVLDVVENSLRVRRGFSTAPTGYGESLSPRQQFRTRHG